ncbi:MAG: hypothetical protein LBI03_09730 [Clostridiales bacterium]|jgi:AAA+ ATPase superfamily predicted ATPase|nr:hypothetical protein [Clostridiales bacterium]
MLLQQELREPAMYNSIISAIAGGSTKLNEIANKIGEESTKVSKYLQTLINLQIIHKLYPFGENPQNSRKGIYRIADNCYDFWYSFVFPNKPEIDSGSGDLVADAEVFGKNISSYIGKLPFETICLQYLQRTNRNKKLPFTATSFGSWWGNDPKEKMQSDFDVIAANRSEKKIILGECKWKNDINFESEAKKLIGKNHLLAEYKDRHYYLFTKTSPEEKQKTESVTIIAAEELFKI